MKKPLTFLIALSVGTLALGAPVLAGGAKGARALTTHGTVCPASAPTIRAWAASVKGYGTYVAPIITEYRSKSCYDYIGHFPTSQSHGHKDQWSADQAALHHCEARKPAGSPGCAIVARSFPLK